MELLKEKPIELDLVGAIANIRREGTPKRVFHFEHGYEPGIKQIACKRFDLCTELDKNDPDFNLKRDVAVHQFFGQEFMRIFPKGIVWQGLPTGTTDTPPAVGPIETWKDFEAYPWPTIEGVDFSCAEWAEKNLPENMAVWSMTYLFQQVSNLFGFAPMCMKLYEDRELVKAIIEKCGALYVKFTETLCDFSRCGAINVGDDMGHKQATLIAPDDLRELFIPWHARIIGAAKERGKIGFFHTCGQMEAVMDDLIDTVKIDAKHSTQDSIEPITISMHRYGDRVALLGGVDVDKITRARAEDMKEYTKNILDHCFQGGGFALGVGNWVADTIPFDNYVAVLETARSYS